MYDSVFIGLKLSSTSMVTNEVVWLAIYLKLNKRYSVVLPQV